MFWSRWTKGTRPAVEAGRTLYAAAAAQARDPAFYTAIGVPDTANGRFEVYSLHVILVLHRLKARGAAAEETAQALFDAYVKSLDDALREQGVGDLSMSKNMRRLGEAFYGRVRSYDAALGNPDELRTLIRRTVYEDKDGPADMLAAYAERSVESLAAESDQAVLRGELRWPAPVT